MQDMYDLWVARNTVNLDGIHPWTSKQLNQWLLSDAPALALRHAVYCGRHAYVRLDVRTRAYTLVKR